MYILYVCVNTAGSCRVLDIVIVRFSLGDEQQQDSGMDGTVCLVDKRMVHFIAWFVLMLVDLFIKLPSDP